MPTPERIPPFASEKSAVGPAYRIVTPRMVIRCYQPADADMLRTASAENKDHLLPFLPWARAEPQSLDEKVALCRMFRGKFDLGQDYIYAILDPGETRLIGGTGLHTRVGEGAREIGYWIDKDFTGQGLITESTAALTRVAFEVDGVNRVEIHVDTRNERSAAVPRRLGYTLEGVLRARLPEADGIPGDMLVFSLFRGEYPATPCAKAEIKAFDAIGRRIL